MLCNVAAVGLVAEQRLHLFTGMKEAALCVVLFCLMTDGDPADASDYVGCQMRYQVAYQPACIANGTTLLCTLACPTEYH
jgi:hypothetical protein